MTVEQLAAELVRMARQDAAHWHEDDLLFALGALADTFCRLTQVDSRGEAFGLALENAVLEAQEGNDDDED